MRSTLAQTCLARAVLIDPGLVGPGEALDRALELWSPGTAVGRTADGRILVTLARPTRVRLGAALGAPLTAADDLPPAAPLDWSAYLAGLPVERLAPVGSPIPPAPPLPPAPAVVADDLRAAAGIGALSPAAGELLADRRGSRRRRTGGAVAGVAAVCGVLFLLAVLSGPVVRAVAADPVAFLRILGAAIVLVMLGPLLRWPSGDDGPPPGRPDPYQAAPQPSPAPSGDRPSRLGSVLALLRRLFRRAGPATGRQAASAPAPAPAPARERPSRFRAALADLAWRTGITRAFAGRHAAYVRRLQKLFQDRDWEEALRDAIPIAGAEGFTVRSLRLPARWAGPLAPTPGGRGGAGGNPFLKDTYFRTLYQQAAEQLEAANRVDEAAYVLADLLGDAAAAIGLLERHRRYAQAAALAEGRRLDPADVMRLWWLAGQRRRALDIARLRGVFAAALDRLGGADAEAARTLRAAWAAERRRDGDLLGAVTVAWPDPMLRAAALPDIEAGIAMGGPATGRLLAHLAAVHPHPGVVDTAVALLAGADDDLRAAREGFLRTFAGLTADDPAADRRLSTLAVRELTRMRLPTVGKNAPWRAVFDRLVARADPLLVADLPPPARYEAAVPGAALTVRADDTYGDLPLHDAAMLPGRVVLAALGGTGARLLGSDGRVRAGWDVPAQRLLIADHGGSALLVSGSPERWELRRLDLAARRMIPGGQALRARRLVGGYGEGILAALDAQGLLFADAHAASPTVLWRELDADHEVHAIGRAPGSLAALVRPPQQDVQLWRWDLHGFTLRQRDRVPFTPGDPAVALADGGFATVADGMLTVHTRARRESPRPVAPGSGLLADGNVFAVVDGSNAPDTTLEVCSSSGELLATVIVPRAGRCGLRVVGDLVTVSDSHGRIVVIDLADRRVVASLRTRHRGPG